MTWSDYNGRDVTAAFLGLTAPVRELYDEIHKRGWTVQKVKIKDHTYHATAKSPHGEKVEAVGRTEATAVGHLLSKIMRKEYSRRHMAAWQTTFEDQLQPIAQAYADAPTYDPKAASAWMELAHDSVMRAQVLQTQLHVEVVDEPNPYKTADEMREDVKEKQHIYVTRAYPHHPVWSMDQVIAFRLVHDVLGHCASGGDWGWHGENEATAAHLPLLGEEAQKALFTECLGQAAYQNVYRDWGPQKIAFLDDLLEKAQKKENKPGHRPTHPSQALAPGGVPDLEKETAPPKKSRSLVGTTPQPTASANVADPNHGWRSGVDPLPDNGYLWQREPTTGVDPLDLANVQEMAYRIDPGLEYMPNSMLKQSIANAFRSAALAPRKSGRDAAQHYQHMANIPADISDPLIYWQALQEQRRQHNINQGLTSPQLPFDMELQQFKQWVKAMNPRMDDSDVHRQAERELVHMLQEEEERILAEDKDEKLSTLEVEMLAYQQLQQRLKNVVKPRIDDKVDYGNHALFREARIIGPYGSYLASHLRPITGVSKALPELTEATHEDLRQGGTGHHFRSTALSLGIPGVTPKMASQAWLMLHPHGSQLAVLDPHTMEALGHDYNKELNDRDYFKFERELAAGRDASGYGHVPLGQFGWGLRDYKLGGPSFHQDLSPYRVLHPAPYEGVDWPSREVGDAGWSDPYWWASTQPQRNQVADDWDRVIAINHPSGSVPFQQKTAALGDPAPSYEHTESGRSEVGVPGESLMQLLKMEFGLNSVHDVWGLQGINAGPKVR
jgi:hypothetical protein